MSPLTTHLFRFATPAPPEEGWAALTTSEPGGGYLPDLSFVSDWAAGSTLVVTTADNPALSCGDVIAAELPRRLSYALDGGRGPATYITWEIRPMPTGSIVRLSVDELDGDGDGQPDLEDIWLPLLARFQLALCPTAGPT
jgi:hypothetical protein